MTIDMEIDIDAELFRCPSCNAANVFLTHSVPNMDSRRHVECRICSMCGPIELSDANAIKAWNDLPRRATPDRTNADAERVSDSLREYTKMKYIGDCKCGQCQFVPLSVIIANADIIEAQSKALAEARAEIERLKL